MEPEKALLQGTASVLEIVSYGYKAALRYVKDIAQLAIPFSVLYGPLAAWYTTMRYQPGGAADMLQNFFIPIAFSIFCCVFAYLCFYIVARYTRDVFWDEKKENIWAYLLPSRELPGALGMALLHGFGMLVLLIGMMVPMFLGLMFLGVLVGVSQAGPPNSLLITTLATVMMLAFVIPFMCLVNSFNAVFSLALSVFLGEPERGVRHSFTRAFSLLRGNFWRTMALGVLFSVVSMILIIPFSLIGGLMGYFGSLNPSFLVSPTYFISYSVLAIISNIVSMSVAGSGFMFTIYRYYYDLELRAGDGDLIRLFDGQSNQETGERKVG